MTNIKQRAQELLTCDELRGRVPEEVQAFLRDFVALEPVGYADSDIPEEVLNLGMTKGSFGCTVPLYSLGATNDPA